jgi:hypothetical protein
MSQVAKLSVSVPLDLARAVRKRVGGRGLSGFVAQALSHEMERAELEGYLETLEAEHGPVPKTNLAAARKAWPKR